MKKPKKQPEIPTTIEVEIEGKKITISANLGSYDGQTFYPEYDYFLSDTNTVSDDAWKVYFSSHCSHDEERWLIEGIKKYLRTEEQRQQLADMDLSIADILSGQYDGEQGKKVRKIFDAWNEKLGYQSFRSY
ncbi:MAG TPA: hypothetical protein VIQ31_08755 [Phormidium sp.]